MKTVKLCDICDVRDGTHDSPSYYSDGYPFITTKNLVNGTIDFSTASLICEEDFRHFDKRSHVDDGDILMPMIGTIGGAIIVNKDREFAIKNVALIKKDKESIDFNFLLHVLNSNKMLTYFEQFKTGGTQKFISLNFIRNLPIPEKSLPEQQKIAAHLDSIQSAIDNKKQQLAQLDELVKSKFVEMFGENPVENGKWKVGKIESVVDRNILTAKKKFQKTDIIKYVDISAIDNKTNLVTGFTEYILEDAPSRAQQAINCDDILISTVRPNLRNIAINPFNDNSMVGSSGFCVLRVNETCNAKYLFYCVLGDDFTNAMVDLTTGAAYPAIKDSDVLAYSIAVPPIELQNTFAEYVQKIDSAKSIIKTQLNDLNELLESKMDFYFGE